VDAQFAAAEGGAFHDRLTGLPNRRLLDDRLGQALHLARRRGRALALALIDIDGFKRVNDALGHPAGDAALREIAARLLAGVRKADTVARHGADEFALVLSDLQGEADGRIAAARVLRALTEPLQAGGQPVTLAVSMGLSLFPADAGDAEALLRNAGAALAGARQAGLNQVVFYRR
jgi:diguanylate cyclase (GGDEF)-like protein